MVQPDPPAAVGRGSTAASVRSATSSVVSLCGSQISTSFGLGREPVEAERAGLAGALLEGPLRHVDDDRLAARHAALADQLPVDDRS